MSSTDTQSQQGSGNQSGPDQGQGQGQGQQQVQIQTSGPQGQPQQGQQGQPGQQMPQLQVIQSPLQNPTYQFQHVYNAQGQPQLITMPFNQLNPVGGIQPAQIAPSIQVIATGKPFQPNQIGNHMLTTTPTGYATIPTSAANNQSYIISNIGQLLNSPQQSTILQQQQGKPGDMQKMNIQPQITQAQLPQGLTWAGPQLLVQSPFIRNPGQGDPNQGQPMFIQQQAIHTNTSGSHQGFTTMPLQTATSNGLQLTSQGPQSLPQTSQANQQPGQQQGGQGQHQQQQQQQGSHPQHSQQGVVGVNLMGKTNPNLQPKPPQPLQIQPSPVSVSQGGGQQGQIQQISVGPPQFQMIPQSSQGLGVGVQGQAIMTAGGQTITTAQLTGQPHPQQGQRHLTILPQQQGGQQVTFIQQPQQMQQPQPIRPNFTVSQAVNNPATPTTATAPAPGQRGKIRKPVARQGNPGQSPNKVMYPRPGGGTPGGMMGKVAPTRTPVSSSSNNPQHQHQQPLKTINIAALQPTPSLPDATLTPLIPHSSNSNQQGGTTTLIQSPQIFTTSQLPTPNISITPTSGPNNTTSTTTHHHQQHSQPHPPPPQLQPAPSAHHKKNEGASSSSSGDSSSSSSSSSSSIENGKGETEKENVKGQKGGHGHHGNHGNHDEGSMVTNTTKHNSKPPKAMVKPQAQILTHVIEGFVIQEASEPFPPVHRNGDLRGDEPPKKKLALPTLSSSTPSSSPSLPPDTAKCEMCGELGPKSKFKVKKGKRFCSSACAKAMKNSQGHHHHHQKIKNQNQNGGKWEESSGGNNMEVLTDETSSSMGDAQVPSTCGSPAMGIIGMDDLDPKMNPVKWNVAEVVDFVRSLPGCSEYADDFAVQEIDGQALMLLKEDHLMSAIGMKLGPALKLCAKIEALRVAHAAASGGGGGSNQGQEQGSCKS